MAARRRGRDVTGARLAALRTHAEAGGPALEDAIAAALADRSAHVVARAATLAGGHGLQRLEPALADALARLLAAAASADPGCSAKAALAEAAVRLGTERGDLMLAGARHVQQEPVWGGRTDTAAGFRAACVTGLVRMAHPQALELVAELLADPEPAARVGAAEAACHAAPHVAVPLLRLRVRAGDPEARVVAACFGALLTLDRAGSIAFVARSLDDPASEVQAAAALALGESRASEALAPLLRWRERHRSRAVDRTALLAIGLLRSEEAISALLGLAADAPSPVARLAVEALGPCCVRPRVRERLEETVQARRGDGLEPALARALEAG